MKGFFVSVVLLVVSVLFTWWWNHDTFDVKYALSERIPVDFGSVQQDAVQQLEVGNVGKTAVDHIVVKLPPRIVKYKIVKYSESDEVKVFPEKFELNYSQLPPQASFRLVIETSGAGVAKSEVQVNHSHGAAEEALTSSGTSSAVIGVVNFLLMFFYVCLIVQGIRNASFDRALSQADFQPETILQKARPFFLAEKKWKEVRKKAVLSFGKKISIEFAIPSNPEDAPLYRALQQAKPNFLSDEEWKIHSDLLRDGFKRQAEVNINSWLTSTDILKYIRLQKPQVFSDVSWADLHEKFEHRYVEVRIREFSRDPKSRLDRPTGLSDNRWKELQELCSAVLCEFVSRELSYKKDPMEFYEQQDLGFLNSEQRSSVHRQAYRLALQAIPDLFSSENAREFLGGERPVWMDGFDFRRLQEVAKGTIHSDTAEALLLCLRAIASGNKVDASLLEGLDLETRQRVLALASKLESISEKAAVATAAVSRRELSLKELEAENEAMKSKLSAQLRIMDRLFADPTYIDRVEEFENPFSIGNFKMLRDFARLLAAETPSRKGTDRV